MLGSVAVRTRAGAGELPLTRAPAPSSSSPGYARLGMDARQHPLHLYDHSGHHPRRRARPGARLNAVLGRRERADRDIIPVRIAE